MVLVALRVTPEQRARLKELGGGAWVREHIDGATAKPPPRVGAGSPLPRQKFAGLTVHAAGRLASDMHDPAIPQTDQTGDPVYERLKAMVLSDLLRDPYAKDRYKALQGQRDVSPPFRRAIRDALADIAAAPHSN